jgi:hypothetical protein
LPEGLNIRAFADGDNTVVTIKDNAGGSQHDLIFNTVRNLSRQTDMYDSTCKILATLSPREEKILRMYFGIGENKKSTIDEIAKCQRKSKKFRKKL